MIQTILSRGTENTRPRDFYDVYMLSCLDYDGHTFLSAFQSTAVHRGSFEKIRNVKPILAEIGASPEMNRRWEQYCRQMPYAEGISFADTIVAITRMLAP